MEPRNGWKTSSPDTATSEELIRSVVGIIADNQLSIADAESLLENVLLRMRASAIVAHIVKDAQ